MSYYTNDFIEEVREKNDIVDVISGYVKLEHKGSVYKGLCPFHSEKTPSFVVYRSSQSYHCFGCGKSGDVFSFLMEYDRDTFSESVENLAARAGMEIPKTSYKERSKEERGERDKLLEIHKETAKFYYCMLYSPAGKNALNYLHRRGLSDSIIKNFGLGYSDRTGQSLYKYLKEKGYTDAELKNSGIFVIDEKHSAARDRFWNRVMFPIMDTNRRVIGFGGRVMGDAQPKYLNSPETKLFEKSRNLYGLHLAKSTRRKNFILCEGYMDVISLHRAGFDNAVASLGTALTSQQCSLIRRYAKEAILLYDSDAAGIKAARRAIPLLRSAGINAKVANMQPYKDPDEFIGALGAEKMQERIDAAENGFMFEIRQTSLEYDLNDPQGMADFQNETVKKLLVFSDEIERMSYMEAVTRQYGIDRDICRRQIAKLAVNVKMPAEEQPPIPPGSKAKISPAEKAEKVLLSWMSQDINIAKTAGEYISEYDFTRELHKKIYRILFEQAKSGRFNPVSILNGMEDLEERSEAAAVLEGTPLPEKSKKETALNEVLMTLKTQTYERSLSEAKNNRPEELQHLLEEKIKLEKLKEDLKITGEN